MHDLRFYIRFRQVTVGDLAEITKSELNGDPSVEVITISSFENAESGAICFYEGKTDEAGAVSSDASACFISQAAAEYLPKGVTALVTSSPRQAFFTAADSFLSVRSLENSYNDLGRPLISATARIGPNAVIGDGAEIGDDSIIGPNVVIGPGVRIGRRSRILAGCVVENALIGNDVLIKSNTVIGGSGFGVIPSTDGLALSPHYGRVVVQDKASIGSNCCIDRGVFGDTIIGEHSHLDNLIQIGHNVEIGRNCVLAAFCGISGSVKVGDWVRMGGRVGVADHIHIGDKASLAANTALMRSVPEGETWGGAPAKPLTHWMREVSWLARQAAKPRKKT